MSNLSKIYGKTNNNSSSNKTEEPLKDDNKAANRVLAGMKIQNSHMRRLNVDGDTFDVPKMEYVHLLDKQLRDLKQENSDLKQKVNKMENTVNSLYASIKELTNKLQRPVFKRRKE